MLTRVQSRLGRGLVAGSEAPAAAPQGPETSARAGGRRRPGEVFLGAGKVLALPVPAIRPDHAGAGWVTQTVKVAGQAADVAVTRVTAGRPSR
jgi:hypothetical protein